MHSLGMLLPLFGLPRAASQVPYAWQAFAHLHELEPPREASSHLSPRAAARPWRTAKRDVHFNATPYIATSGDSRHNCGVSAQSEKRAKLRMRHDIRNEIDAAGIKRISDENAVRSRIVICRIHELLEDQQSGGQL